VLFWLGVAVSIAVLAQVITAFQDYFARLAVKKFGMQIFNDGLQQTLCLTYDEYEKQRSGETIAFVGPSGSGKSTLVKLLLGLYSPVSGEIWFNGHPSSQIRYNPLRRQIGFVVQDAQLFAGTINENLLFIQPDATDAQIMDALHKAARYNLLADSSPGLDTVIGEGGMNLSSGPVFFL